MKSTDWTRITLDHLPDGILFVQDELIEYSNQAMQQLLGMTSGQLVGRRFGEIIHPDDDPKVGGLIDGLRSGEPGVPLIVRIVGLDDRAVITEFIPRIVESDENRLSWIGIFRDLTIETRIGGVIGEGDEKNRLLIENAPEAIVVYDVRHGKFVDANEKAVWLFGMERSVIFKKGFLELSQYAESEIDQFKEHLQQQITRAAEGENVEFEWICVGAAGRTIPCEVRMALLPSQERNLIRCSLVDITDRKLAEDDLIHEALYDPLTDLANRSLFYDRLDASIRRSLSDSDFSFAVIFFDLDRFKNINDSLGHMAGDQLLIAIAQRLEKVIGEKDLAARIAGDEFAILLEDYREQAYPHEVAKKILAALKPPIELSDQEVLVSASIGVAEGAIGYNKSENIMRDADTAMYQAKSKGKSRFEIFDPKVHPRAVDLLRLENELRGALLRDEFVLFYEPIVSVKSRQITGLEVFIRWQHPERGLLMPANFIKHAEEVGLITRIDAWVLKNACMHFKDWVPKLSVPGRLAVNLSKHHIFRMNTIDLIEEALQAADLPASVLELELLESVLVNDLEHMVDAMAAMKKLGLRLSLDDFGAVYSSLSQLRHLPVDNLRIDKTLVQGIVHDESSQAIVSSIISMAKRLGLEVIAEGVEDHAQLDLLAEWGCDEVQGYIFGPSLPADQVSGLLESGFDLSQ